jgi:hypothetical protein
MKSCQLEDAKGKPLDEMVLIFSAKECNIIHAAMKEYTENHKQMKLAKVLFNDLSDAGIY